MKNIILVGNPNVGKTTLFNTLTKSNKKANNWHGVTVDVESKEYKYNGEVFNVSDIPGIYSLDGFSNEEKIACKYLCDNSKDLIVNICDANNLKKNLYLTKHLLEKSYNVILAVNMINEVKNLDLDALEKMLNVKVVGIDARKSKSVEKLKEAIFEQVNSNNNNFNSTTVKRFFANIEKIDKYIYDTNKNIPKDFTEKIDKIVLNKFLFLPIFIGVIFLIFYLTFGDFGEIIQGVFKKLVEPIFLKIEEFIKSLKTSKVIQDLLINGILYSIKIVCELLPHIVLLMMFVNILEDIGFMSRVAFMFDGGLKKIGLTGKSLFSVMMGYGCTTSAIITTRNLEKRSLRKRTALILPFSICTAKLPIFLTISSLFFNEYKYIFVFLLYLLSVVLIVIFSLFYKKNIPNEEDYFVLEMPKYRLPYLKKIIKDSLSVVVEFFYKVGSTIVIAGAIFWVLQNFSFKTGYLNGERFNESILFYISSKFSFLFKPIGLGQTGIIAVLFFGLIAKELIVLGLAAVNGVAGSIEMLESTLLSTSSICYFTKSSSIIFLLFILLYSPCFSAIFTIKNEFDIKTALFVFIFQFIVSYLICFVINAILVKKYLVFLIAFIIILALIITFMIKSTHKKICRGNCSACRKL